MKRLVLLALVVLIAACGRDISVSTVESQGAPAIVLGADGAVIASYGEGGFVGAAPELSYLLDTEIVADGSLISGGVVFATAFDSELQAHFRTALGQVSSVEGLTAAVVAVDRGTGAIRAAALSDFGESNGGLDAAFGLGRPTGSALKPIALAAALDSGRTLETTYFAPDCIAIPDSPGDQTCGGPGVDLTLLEATVSSINPVFVQLVDDIGVDRFGKVAAGLGISQGARFLTIDSVLGTYSVSVWEMAGAYRAIAEGGSYVPPHLVQASGDGSGLIATELGPIQVLSPSVWMDVDFALREVINRGTGAAADPGIEAAGKTGTARSFTDAWFAGYTKDLVIALWVGFGDDPARSMVFPATPLTITGGSWPAEIWANLAGGSS